MVDNGDYLLPPAESVRLAALHATGPLDSAPEASFDRVAELAATLLRAPVSLVSLVEPHRQFLKAAFDPSGSLGSDRQTPASHSICKTVVALAEPVVLPDTRSDEAFCAHPAVVDFDIGAYLGVPLRGPEGEVLGALCVIDSEPHPWTENDVDVLTRLSGTVTDLVNLHLTSRKLENERREHDATRSLTDYYLDVLDDIFFVADIAGHLLRWNRAAEEVTGLDAQELLEQPFLAFFAAADRGRVAAAVGEAVEMGRTQVEADLLTAQGPRPYELTAVFLPDSGLLCGVGRDISMRRAAEEAERASEERYRLLTETATDAILIVDTSWTVRYANRAVESILGYLPHEIVGSPLSAIVPERLRAAHEAGVARYLISGERRLDWRRVEVPGRRKDGSEVPLALSFGAYAAGGEQYFTAIIRDVSAQREADRALRESERRFRSFVEATSQVVYGADTEGNIEVWSQDKWTALTGQTAEEANGWGWAETLHPGDARVLDEWRHHVAEQIPYETEFRFRCQDGSYRRGHVHVVPIFDESRTLVEWVGTLTDVEEARQAEVERTEALARLQLALDAAQMGKWDYEFETGTVTYSDKARDLLESASGLGTETFGYSMVAKEDREAVREAFAVAATGEADGLSIDYRIVHADGSVRWFQTVGRTFHDAAGRPSRLVGTIVDITHQKEYEETLRKSEERYRSLFESMDQGYCVIELALGTTAAAPRFVEANPAFVRNMGPITGGEVEGALRERWVRACRRVVETGQALRFDQTCDSSGRWFEVHATLLSGGRRSRVALLFTDVSERKRYEEGLIAAKEAAEEARAAAEEASRLKASLLANMSHEIRTPLTGVIGYAELLAQTAADEDAEFVDAIRRGADRLLHTLNSVLELSQIDAGAHTLRLQPVDVREVVTESAGLLRPQAAAAGLALTVDVPDAAVLAGADSSALSRVVTNLLSNAIKYTEAGAVTVSVKALREGGAELRVADTGTGIATDFLPHLFEEFRQESEGDGRRYEGAGLGLAIVRRLVEAMGGEIAVESEKGVGSTFTVRLRPPAVTASREPAAQAGA